MKKMSCLKIILIFSGFLIVLTSIITSQEFLSNADVEIFYKEYIYDSTSKFTEYEMIKNKKVKRLTFNYYYNNFLEYDDTKLYFYFVSEFCNDSIILLRTIKDKQKNKFTKDTVYKNLLSNIQKSQFADSLSVSINKSKQSSLLFTRDYELIINNKSYEFEISFDLNFNIIFYNNDLKKVIVEITNKAPDFLNENRQDK